MPNSVRENILANLQTTLEAITTGNGYNNTISKVQRIRATPVNHTDFPSINIFEQKMTAEIDPYGFTTKRLPIILELWTQDAGEDLSIAINKFLLDIEKAVKADTTRGGYAIDTYYDGDEIYLANGNQISIGCYCFITVKFRTNFKDPTSQV